MWHIFRGGFGPHMGFSSGFGDSWMWFAGIGIFRLLIIIGIIILVVKLFNRDKKYDYMTSNRALDILNEKYAKGEITEEEYKQRKNNLLS